VIHLELERTGAVPVVRPRGDIDAANAAAVHDELADCVGPESPCIVLDLSDTAYVDSAGLDVLLRLSERLRQRRATLLLVIPASSQLSRLAAIVGLGEAMPVHETLTQAVASCGG
jgi:anti-anti-sigma factor